MSRRISVLVATVLLVLCFTVSSAMAWGDGGDGAAGFNGYGTHDWILDHAIALARKTNPRGVAWIDVATALYHTNDPDYGRLFPNDRSVDPQNDMWHVFQPSGQGRGGPQAATNYYYKVLRALASGNNELASRYLGVMSHYYDDPTQPFHTEHDASASTAQKHADYEIEVDKYTSSYSKGTDWLHTRAPGTITDIRTAAVNASLLARTKFTTLRDKYSKGDVKSNDAVNAATGVVLSRAVNDLADIIRSIPNTSAVSQPPAKMITTISRRYTGLSHGLHVTVKCVDSKGRILQGVPVDFWWPTKSGGTTKQSCYSQSNGVSTTWYTVPKDMPLMKKWIVTVRASSVGTQTSASTWFMVSPHLANGSAGIKTTVSSRKPAQNSVVHARTVVHAKNGKPVAGLNCTFLWEFKSHTYTYNTVTDAKGVARASRNIGTAKKGYRVHVRAQVISDTYHRSSTASFVPH